MGKVKRERISEKITKIRVLSNLIAPPNLGGEMTISTTLFQDKITTGKFFSLSRRHWPRP